MLKWKIRSLSHSIPGDIKEKEIARIAAMFAEGINLYVSKKILQLYWIDGQSSVFTQLRTERIIPRCPSVLLSRELPPGGGSSWSISISLITVWALTFGPIDDRAWDYSRISGMKDALEIYKTWFRTRTIASRFRAEKMVAISLYWMVWLFLL